ncbi:MAG: coenzyme F420 hydrogenase/dehydrogenase beta subunit N-terminal domain-containing protein [Planctomycetota bacterium]
MHNNLFTIGEVRTFWDAVAPRYDAVNAGFSWTHNERFHSMQEYLTRQSGLSIINVWSRTGSAAPYIREVCPDARVVHLEVSDAMRSIAQSRFPDEVFESTNLHDLPFPDESQDVVVSLETLEHVPDPLHFLLECHRVLKPGGRLILSAPPAWSETFLRIYERFFDNHGEGPHRFPRVGAVLAAMRNCGFSVVEHRGTVLLPVGPEWARRAAEWLQRHVLRHLGTNRLGIRHFYIAEKRAAHDPVWAKLHEEVIAPGLCSRCGTCVGLSEGKIEFADRDARCLPEVVAADPLPGVCYDACPEVRPSYAEMSHALFADSKESSLYFGHYRRLLVAHSTDETIRHSAASGGVLSAALVHLLETGQITGAVVLGMESDRPWRSSPFVARTTEEILAAAQSKYVVSPMNTILRALSQRGANAVDTERLAFVGLPHQVFAIRRLQQMRHPSVASIGVVLGPFFGNEMYGSAVDGFLRKFSAPKEDVVRLSYRHGAWPGQMKAWLRDGREVQMPKFHANYLIPFHITDNSLLSQDLTNELTDLSGGDAWAPMYEQRRQGFSLVVTRTAQADTLIDQMQEDGRLWVQPIEHAEAVAMQSHGLDFKKRGGYLRMRQRARAGLRTVDYGYTPPPITASRAAFEVVLSTLFACCSTRLARRLADAAPNGLIGPMFQWFRTVWKAATKQVKREGLEQDKMVTAKG